MSSLKHHAVVNKDFMKSTMKCTNEICNEIHSEIRNKMRTLARNDHSLLIHFVVRVNKVHKNIFFIALLSFLFCLGNFFSIV